MTGRTPIYGISYPDGTTKASKLGDELGAMGISVEAALVAAGVPAVTNPDQATAGSDVARNAHFGIPSTEAERLALQRRGATCVRHDKGWTERYFATYDANTNPSGASTAGWYPVAGRLPHGIVYRSTVPVDTELWTLFATGSWWANHDTWGVNPFDGTWTVPMDGLYEVFAGFKLNGTVNALAVIKRNSATLNADKGVAMGGGVGGNGITMATAFNQTELKAGDVLRLATFSSAKAAWSQVAGEQNLSYFGLRFLEPARVIPA